MNVCAHLPAAGRDLRLDLFRGLANWAIFLDHIPHEVLNSATTRNYGFSDGADLFVFISGYTAAFVFGRIMIERGYLAAASRLVKRTLQLYAAHILVVVVYIAVIAGVSQELHDPNDLNVFNAAAFISKPLWEFFQAMALRYRPVNLDVLPLYILLVGTFAPALWLMVRKPTLILVCSTALYLAGRHFGWNLPSSRSAVWYFNPFAWQLLFFLGAWTAVGGAEAVEIDRSNTDGVLSCDQLPRLCPGGDNGDQLTSPRQCCSLLDAGAVRSQRQDQSRTLPNCAPDSARDHNHAVPACRFGHSEMALTDAADQVRSELATRVLHRHRAVVLCSRRDRRKPELALGSDFLCRPRRGAHDRSRLLLRLAQKT